MYSTTSRSLALLSALMLVGAGCSNAPASPSAPAEGRPTAAGSLAVGSSDCSNPYYPLNEGHTISYTSKVQGIADSGFTTKVTEASANNATVQYTFQRPGTTADAALSVTQKLSCSGGNLSATGFLDMGSALGGRKITTKTKKAFGELIPSNLSVGSEWSNEFQVQTDIDNPEAARLGMGSASSTMTTHNKVVREEQVTVPAGTYTALVIESDMTMVMQLGNLPTKPTTTKTTAWWAKSVGMVKSDSGTSKTEATAVTP